MPHCMQQMTLSDHECPFHASRAISAVGELLVFSLVSIFVIVIVNENFTDWLSYVASFSSYRCVLPPYLSNLSSLNQEETCKRIQQRSLT